MNKSYPLPNPYSHNPWYKKWGHSKCPVQFAPEERHNALRVSQNVILEDLEFINCDFIGEGLATYGAPIHRSTARNIHVKDCRVNSFFGNGAIFDGITIDGLQTSRAPVILNGCAFRHVTLRGQVGRFLFNSNVSPDEDRRNTAFAVANAAFFDAIDWALDITDVKASGIEIRGAIPASLIRRNPEEHFLMTREVAFSKEWSNFDPFGSFDIAISIFLDSGADQELFVAARRSRRFKEEQSYFLRLRDAGLVS